jgi:hypothetical protein
VADCDVVVCSVTIDMGYSKLRNTCSALAKYRHAKFTRITLRVLCVPIFTERVAVLLVCGDGNGSIRRLRYLVLFLPVADGRANRIFGQHGAVDLDRR